MALVTGLHCPGIPGVPAIFAEKGSYASGAYIGEERCQHLKMGFPAWARARSGGGQRVGPRPMLLFMTLS
jgi:hypothetical protein